MFPGKIMLLIVICVSIGMAATFVNSPTISDSEGVAVIKFSVSSPVDVEVAIMDKDGKVACHLAQGLLGGEKAPPAPLVEGLSQRIVWDGKGDLGASLENRAPLQLRVRLGVYPEFDKRVKTNVFKANSGALYGADTVVSDSDLISMTHPLWSEGGFANPYSKTNPLNMNPDGTYKIAFYFSSTLLDVVASNETDQFLIKVERKGGGNYVPLIARFNGITGDTINTWPQAPAATVKGWWGVSVGFFLPDTDMKSAPNYGEPIMDPYGRFVLHDEGTSYGHLFKFTLAGQPIEVGNGKNIMIQPSHGDADRRNRGTAIGYDGTIYAARYPLRTDVSADIDRYHDVSKLDSNGNLIQYNFLKTYANIVQGIRVDMKGNLFVGMHLKPVGDTVPKSIRAKLQGSFDDPWSQAYWADELYGSIAKFGPTGGLIAPDVNGAYWGGGLGGGVNTRVSATGMEWAYYGASFQANHSARAVGCYCYTPRFDVDRFGRVIFPNPFENEIKALDNNGNVLFRVHNRDVLSKVKIGSPNGVSSTDRGLYVADHTNNQVVIFVWKAETEESVAIPAGLAIEASPLRGALQVFSGPNPFSQHTTLRVQNLRPQEAALASLRIYSATGQLVTDLTAEVQKGRQAISWNGRAENGRLLPSGVYYCRLTLAGKTMSRALLLTR